MPTPEQAAVIKVMVGSRYDFMSRSEILDKHIPLFYSIDEGAAIRAEQILHWMTKLCNDGNEDVKPDRYTYNTCIHAYAKVNYSKKLIAFVII